MASGLLKHPGPNSGGRRDRESGVALLIALVTITLVTISVMQFTHTRQVDYRRTAHWMQAKQAGLYADDALEFAQVLLAADGGISSVDGLGEQWARFCVPDTLDHCPTDLPICALPPFHAYADEGGVDPSHLVALRIEDMSGRYNLNRLRTGHNVDVERDVARELFALSEVDPDLIGPIVDWIDADGELYRYGSGAEDPQYSETKPRYSPRNAELESLRELALVKGVEHDDLVRLQPNVATLPSDASKAVNINTAPRIVLRALAALDPAMADESLLGAILSERCTAPFESAADLNERVPGFPGRVNTDRWIRFDSSYFRLLATAKVDEVYQSIEALLHRTDQGIRIVYYLARRGAVIGGIDDSEAARSSDLDFLGTRRVGVF